MAQPVCGPNVEIRGWQADAQGPSAFAYANGYLYVGYRTTSIIARFELSDISVPNPLQGELIADFSRVGGKVDIIDMSFSQDGRLLVSTASMGGVWAIEPDPRSPFVPQARTPNAIDMRRLTGNSRAKCSNIAVDSLGHIYLCSNNDDNQEPNPVAVGTIYRAVMDA